MTRRSTQGWLKSLNLERLINGVRNRKEMKMQRLLPGNVLLWCGLVSVCGCLSERAPVSPTSSAENVAPSSNNSEKESPTQADSVELGLNWLPEAEHGGYYAAGVHRLFAEQRLKVTINAGGPGVPVIKNVASGKVLFGVTNADQLLIERAQEADVVAVFAPIQHSPRCIMVHKQSGITKFDDLKDMTLSISANQTFLAYLKKKQPLPNVRIVPYTGSIGPFLQEEQIGVQAYVFSEPFLAQQQGAEPVNLMVSDLGFNPYTSILITRANVIAEQPDLVRRMVAACQAGWRKYLDAPEKTNEKIYNLNDQMNLEILAFGVRELKPLCERGLSSPDRLGEMTAERWQTLADQLVEAEVLKPGAVDPAKAFDASFLPKSP